jgi:hypothetical protein
MPRSKAIIIIMADFVPHVGEGTMRHHGAWHGTAGRAKGLKGKRLLNLTPAKNGDIQAETRALGDLFSIHTPGGEGCGGPGGVMGTDRIDGGARPRSEANVIRTTQAGWAHHHPPSMNECVVLLLCVCGV